MKQSILLNVHVNEISPLQGELSFDIVVDIPDHGPVRFEGKIMATRVEILDPTK